MPGHYLSCFVPGNKAWVRLKYGLSFNIQTTYKPQPFIDPSASNEPEHSTYRLLNTDAKYRGPESILETTQKEHSRSSCKQLVFSTRQELNGVVLLISIKVLQTIRTYLHARKWRAAASRRVFAAIIELEHFKAVAGHYNCYFIVFSTDINTSALGSVQLRLQQVLYKPLENGHSCSPELPVLRLARQHHQFLQLLGSVDYCSF